MPVTARIPWDRRNDAPLSPPYDTGYDVRTASLAPPGVASGFLADAVTGEFVDLWVYDVSTDIALAGQTAQAEFTRDFFAHNMVQSAYHVACQAPNQRMLGRTIEFIHELQHRAVSTRTLSGLSIETGGLANTGTFGNMKGTHDPIMAQGYILNASRKHSNSDRDPKYFAPDFTFDFVVSQSEIGIFHDDAVTINRLKSWAEIVQGIIAHDDNAGFIEDPDARKQGEKKRQTREKGASKSKRKDNKFPSVGGTVDTGITGTGGTA